MSEPARDIDPELAAQLTLFAMRAAVPSHWTLRHDAFIPRYRARA